MSGTYSDGTPFDFTVCTTPFLYSAAISDPAVLAPYIADADHLFGAGSSPAAPAAAFGSLPAAPLAGLAVQFTDASSGSPTAWTWAFGDGGTSTAQSPSHIYKTPGTFTVSLTVSSATGSDTATSKVTVAPSCTITAVTLTQSPFGLRIQGTGFRSACKVLINGRVAPTTLRASSTTLFARGAGLAARLPKGVAVQIVVRNSNGGRSTACAYTR